jgi:transposase
LEVIQAWGILFILNPYNMEKENETQAFEIVHPNAAGIDVSSEDYFIAVPVDRDEQPVRRFGCFTESLFQIVHWLKKCRITSVAMESTGVYWVQLFMVLQDHGFEVFLVNAQQIKNVSGKKSDVCDCQWIQQLHTCGLLANSYQPDTITKELRTYVRQRKKLTESANKEVLRMQKSMTLMNIKLDRVITDIMGKSGRNIIQAILSGERDPEALVRLTDRRLKASKEDLIKSLEADWRKEHLFTLRQSFEIHEFCQAKIIECDKQIEQVLAIYPRAEILNENSESLNPFKKKQKQKTDFTFNPEKQLKGILGIDVTQIPGFSSVTAITILSETGKDLQDSFPSKKQFLSWLNLVPNNRKTAGKVISSKVKKKKNKTGQSFRLAANALKNSKCPFGDYFRKVKSRDGHGRAIIATANKLAGIYYTLVTTKQEFNMAIYMQSYKINVEKKLVRLNKKIIDLQNQLLYIPDKHGVLTT